MVYCTGLENRRPRKGSVGSNPTLSAKGHPACSVWGYKGESVNGTHDGTYTEETRRDSKTSSKLESCPSGLWSTLGKRVHPKGCHRFESYTLRQIFRVRIAVECTCLVSKRRNPTSVRIRHPDLNNGTVVDWLRHPPAKRARWVRFLPVPQKNKSDGSRKTRKDRSF